MMATSATRDHDSDSGVIRARRDDPACNATAIITPPNIRMKTADSHHAAANNAAIASAMLTLIAN